MEWGLPKHSVSHDTESVNGNTPPRHTAPTDAASHDTASVGKLSKPKKADWEGELSIGELRGTKGN